MTTRGPGAGVRLATALVVSIVSWTALTPAARGATVTVSTEPDGAVVARSAHLEMRVAADTGRVEVTDLRNGTVWSSVPSLPSGTRIVGLWRAHMDAGFILEYAEVDRQPRGVLNTSRYRPVPWVEPTPDGARVRFDVLDPAGEKLFGFAWELSLGEDHLDLRIPFASLYERPGGLKLISIMPFPFFGAATDLDDGYAFFPDGPGAISRFKVDHPTYQQNFREWVYQSGPEYVPGGAGQVRLPVFGIKRGAAAYVGFITQGDADAQIEFSPSGYILPLYRVAPVFHFRQRFSVALRRDAFVEKVDEALIPGDRSVRYVFLHGEDADYSGMARAYRRHLLEAGRLARTIPPDFAGYLDLSLFMAIEKPLLLWSSLVPMTTFAQARQILEELRRHGIERVALTLMGWTTRGYMGAPPARFPVEEALGGEAGLRELVTYAREHGIEVWLYDQFLWAAQGAAGYSERRDVVRRASRDLLGFSRALSPVPSLRTERRYYLLNPLAAIAIARRDVPRLAALGVTGVVDENVGALVHVDHNPARAMGRADFIAALQELAGVYRGSGLKVGVNKGNGFILGSVDRLLDIPMEGGRLLFADESVPFYQMVVHGYIPYSGDFFEAGNLRADPAIERLRAIEFGALPRYVLTYEATSSLADTWFSQLYSSRYTDWIDSLVEDYRILVEELGRLQAVPMQAHRRLDEGVYEVRYEDGSRVIVNYRAQTYSLNGERSPRSVSVPPLGHVVLWGQGDEGGAGS